MTNSHIRASVIQAMSLCGTRYRLLQVPYMTLFGQEFEVCGHAALSTNKTQNLNAERKGDITGDYALRRPRVFY